MIKNIYELSKTGFAGQNKKKINQDNYFIYKNFNNNRDSIFYGVWYKYSKIVMDMDQMATKFHIILKRLYRNI
jgi:hypothetical protein